MISQHHSTTPSLPPRIDPRAIASVVFGILALGIPVVPALVAITLARRVHRQVEVAGGRRASQDLASVGGTLGWCSLAILAAFVALLTVVAVFGISLGAADTTTPPPTW